MLFYRFDKAILVLTTALFINVYVFSVNFCGFSDVFNIKRILFATPEPSFQGREGIWAGGVVGERKEEKGRGREGKQRDGEEGRGEEGRGRDSSTSPFSAVNRSYEASISLRF